MAKEILSDEFCGIVDPLIPKPPPRPKGGRPRVSDRAALKGILFVLLTGMSWEYLPPKMGCGSGMTCWRRLRDWQKAGVWDELHAVTLDKLESARLIEWERFGRFFAGCRAACQQKGGAEEAVGPSPTDRGKLGCKRHIIVDRRGTPLGVTPSGANVHDSNIWKPSLMPCPRCARAGQARRGSGPRKSTPTKDTTTPAAEAEHHRRIARRGVKSWGGIVGRWSRRRAG